MSNIIDTEIKHSTLIKAPIGKVYDAFTTSEGLDSWFTFGAKVERKPGGWIYFRWSPEKSDITDGVIEDEGPVVEVEINKKFVFRWSPDNKMYTTTVEMIFEETDKGVKVTVREKGFQDTPEGRKAQLSCATGWGEALTMVKFYLEHGVNY